MAVLKNMYWTDQDGDTSALEMRVDNETSKAITDAHLANAILATAIPKINSMTETDKTKLDSIAAGATKVEDSSINGNIKINGSESVVYSHPTGDGNQHVPVTGINNKDKVLVAGGAAGSMAWKEISRDMLDSDLYGIIGDAESWWNYDYDGVPSIPPILNIGELALFFTEITEEVNNLKNSDTVITNEQIKDMRKNIADARLAAAILATAVPKIESANEEYSESVQRIGTWIDGTPVWRIAFKRTLTQNEISAGRVQLSELLPIKGTGFSNGFVVNSSVSIYLGYPCAVDDIACGPIVRCAVQLNTYLPSGVNLMADNDGIFGYIDFATSESNLQ